MEEFWNNHKTKIIILVIVLVLIFVGMYFYKKNAPIKGSDGQQYRLNEEGKKQYGSVSEALEKMKAKILSIPDWKAQVSIDGKVDETKLLNQAIYALISLDKVIEQLPA
jgi:hypothetical protein